MSDLFDRVVCMSNLRRAFERVAAKKSQGGVDRVTVEEFGQHSDRNLKALQGQLLDGSYVPAPVAEICVPKFNDAGEYRRLGLPTVADKIAQAAMLEIVFPLAEKMFLDVSYGYRPGKGHFKAIRRVEHNLVASGGLRWVVHQDIDNFFDTLNHDRLLTLFARLVGNDQRLVELVALWCRCGIVARDGRWKNVEAGVRQGQVISPLLANLYLHALDEFAVSKRIGWVRYADDYLIQCGSEDDAVAADREIAAFIRNELHLGLNRNDSPVAHIDQGFEFLGVFFRGEERRISDGKIRKMKRRIERIFQPTKTNSDPAAVLSGLSEKYGAWRRYYGFLRPQAQFMEIDAFARDAFRTLAGMRMSAGDWPKEPPAGLSYPSFSDAEGRPGETAAKLWSEAAASLVAPAARKLADDKIVRRRNRHVKEQIGEGEVLVLTPGHFVGRRGERIVIRRQQTVVSEVLGMRLKSLMLGGHGQAVSTDVIRYCSQRDIPVHFVDGLGRIFATIANPESSNAELIGLQVEAKDSVKGWDIARMFVLGKMKNQMALLKGYAKNIRESRSGYIAAFRQARADMENIIMKVKKLRKTGDTAAFYRTLMGLEGILAAKYWGLVKMLIPETLSFQGRTGKGAGDMVNMLLNYGYGILYSHVHNAVVKAGLNPMAGFLHADQQGRPSLVLDMVEEFRAPVVDRAVFTILNRKEPVRTDPDGSLCDATRKKTAAAVLDRLGAEVACRGLRMSIKDAMLRQATAVCNCLKGGAVYRPLLVRW